METGSSESGLGFKTGAAKPTLHTEAQQQVQILFYLTGFLLRVQRVGCLGVTIPTSRGSPYSCLGPTGGLGALWGADDDYSQRLSGGGGLQAWFEVTC